MSFFGLRFKKSYKQNNHFARVSFLCLFLTSALIAVPSTASAQTKVETTNTTQNSGPSEGLTLNLKDPVHPLEFESTEFVGLSPSLQDVVLEVPTRSVGSRLFDLDMTNISCLTGEEGCTRRSETLDVGYEKSILTKFDGKFDIQLTPRASVSFNDESSSAVVGALVRIGDDLREDPDLKANTWYMFAGADAEAVTYSPDSIRRITGGQFHLQDRIIVGDAQAGVGYRIGDADVSLGYFRREVTSFGREIDANSVTFKEDAAALSFTWRR